MPAPAPNLQMHERPRVRARESAFTVVEMVVAVAIVLVLMGGTVLALNGAKGTVYGKEAITVGSAYNNAIAKWQADHANMVPRASDMIQAGSAKSPGPKSLLNPNRPYLSQVPDAVQAGRVAVDMGGRNCGTTAAAPSGLGAATGMVSYCAGAAPAYGVRVVYQTSKDGPWQLCWMGNTPNAPTCSK